MLTHLGAENIKMGSLVLLHLLLLLILSGDVELNPGDETLLIDTTKKKKKHFF